MLVHILWFFAGVVVTVAALVLLLPWLRTVPRLGPLPVASLPLVLVAGAVLVFTGASYLWLGRHELLQSPVPSPVVMPAPAMRSDVLTQQDMGVVSKGSAGSMPSAVAGLEARLAKGGGADADWELLAKSYDFMGRPDDAAKARAKRLPADGATAAGVNAAGAVIAGSALPQPLSASATKTLEQADAARRARDYAGALTLYAKLAASGELNADGWADYADVTALRNGGKLVGEPEQYIARALALDPRHEKALWLKASADEEAGRWSEAVTRWQELLAVLPKDSADSKVVGENLRQDLRQSAGLQTGAQMAKAAPPAGALAITGEIVLADALKARVASGLTLFVVAKSVDSPGIPVAVLRLTTGEWPVRFVLDNSQAMMPGRTISTAGRVTVEVRISRSGQAAQATGDLSGSSGVVDPAAHPRLRIIIDKVVG